MRKHAHKQCPKDGVELKYFIHLLLLLTFCQKVLQRARKCTMCKEMRVLLPCHSFLFIRKLIIYPLDQMLGITDSCFKNILIGSDQKSNWFNILSVTASLTAVQGKEKKNITSLP